MNINTRLTKLEQKLLPNKGDNIEVVICEIGETPEQACKRLGIDPNPDGVQLRINVVFD